MNTRSLRFQLVASYTALLAVAFAVLSLFMYFALHRMLVENLKDLLARRVRKLAHLSMEADKPLTTEWVREQVTELFAPETPEGVGRFLRISQGDGTILYVSGPPADGGFDPKAVKPLNPHETQVFRSEYPGETEVLIRLERVAAPSGLLLIEAGGAMSSIDTAVRHTMFSLAFAAPPFILVAVGGAYMLIGRALRPVVLMTRSAEAISLQNPGGKLPALRTGDELETLSLALNRMIRRLHESVENTRRFVADASHELRTPLAVLRGEMENVMNHDRLSPQARERVASNLEEVERLGKIVQGLFALSRLDCGEAQNESTVFDLATVAATTTEQMCLLAEDKGITLACHGLARSMIRGDPSRIKQIIVNLVDNAINYTQEGGRVEVRTFTDGNRAILEVQDTGIGIPREAHEKIFERFFRVDKARSRDVGGAGLGLSIVKAICLAHSGEIHVQSEIGKGSLLRIEFPAQSIDPNTGLTAGELLKKTGLVPTT